MGLFHQLYHTGFGSRRPLFSNLDAWASNLATVVVLLIGCGLFWLHSSSREQAHQALKGAMETLRESEGKLSSLIESTDDFVMSLDTEGRRVAANQPALRLISALTGSELPPGAPLFPPEPPAPWSELWVLFQRALTGQRGRTEVEFPLEGRSLTVETLASPVLSKEGRVVGVTFFARDISARKEAEARLTELHRGLLDVSRQAGMAEVATGVLHNVGNTLNSVNVSVEMVREQLRGSRVSGLARATLLRQAGHPGAARVCRGAAGAGGSAQAVADPLQPAEQRAACAPGEWPCGQAAHPSDWRGKGRGAAAPQGGGQRDGHLRGDPAAALHPGLHDEEGGARLWPRVGTHEPWHPAGPCKSYRLLGRHGPPSPAKALK